MNKLLAFPLFVYAILYLVAWMFNLNSGVSIDPGSITILVALAVSLAIVAGLAIPGGNTGVSALTLQSVGETVIFGAFVAGSASLFNGAGVLGIIFGAVFTLMYGVGVLQQLDFGGGGG